eukprot:2804165-Ditylum_brightwellii.AAC.1
MVKAKEQHMADLRATTSRDALESQEIDRNAPEVGTNVKEKRFYSSTYMFGPKKQHYGTQKEKWW